MTRILFWILGLLAIGLFVRLWVGPGSYPDIQNLEKQIEAQNIANDEHAERNLRLQRDVSALSGDDAAVEAHARSELGMIRKDETFYQIILESDPNASVPPTPVDVKETPYVE